MEAYLLAGQVPLQHHDLVTEGEDFRVLGLAAHRQEPQHRQRVRHTEVRESQWHKEPSLRSDVQRFDQPGTRRLEQDLLRRPAGHHQGGWDYRHPQGRFARLHAWMTCQFAAIDVPAYGVDLPPGASRHATC